MTFRQYILGTEVTNDPRGDFILDARREISAGKFWKRGSELHGIEGIADCDAREAALEVYDEWKKAAH